MKKFTTPYLAKYGKATDVIKGSCGWGKENYKLDKTGASYKSVRRIIAHQNAWWQWTTCETRSICNGRSNEC